MSYEQDLAYDRPVAELDENTRATFVMRTYGHLIGAISAFVILEMLIFQLGFAERIGTALMEYPLIVLGGFILIGWGASHTAHRVKSLPMQYSALAATVALWAFMFVPILFIAHTHAPGVITKAAIASVVGFVGLTIIAWTLRKDFSFLRGFLMWGGFCALGIIVFAAFTGLDLGVWFSVGMIALAGGAILYDTSNVMHHYPEDRYVAASLELFASVALLFWYVLRLFMQLQRD